MKACASWEPDPCADVRRAVVTLLDYEQGSRRVPGMAKPARLPTPLHATAISSTTCASDEVGSRHQYTNPNTSFIASCSYVHAEALRLICSILSGFNVAISGSVTQPSASKCPSTLVSTE
jgi:hypothetical protein